MRKSVLIRFSVLVEADLVDDESSELDATINRIDDALRNVLGREVGYEAARCVVLDPAHLNCGTCAACGAWVTDCERPGRIDGLNNGAVVDGRLLCDEHLPNHHRWAF